MYTLFSGNEINGFKSSTVNQSQNGFHPSITNTPLIFKRVVILFQNSFLLACTDILSSKVIGILVLSLPAFPNKYVIHGFLREK